MGQLVLLTLKSNKVKVKSNLVVGNTYILNWWNLIFIGVLEKIVYYNINKYTCKDTKILTAEEKPGTHYPQLIFRSKQQIANQAGIQLMCEYIDGTFGYTVYCQIFKENVLDSLPYTWFLKKFTEIRNNAINDIALDINVNIAVNMFTKNHLVKRQLDLFKNILISQGTEIVLDKQIAFEGICNFQVSQLPF